MAFFSRLTRAKTDSKPESTAPGAQQQRAFRSVEIIPHAAGHCGAVGELTGYRILADEAPSLPLPDCDYADCKCRYAPYKDRRAGSRRDADIGIGGVASMLQIDNARSDAAGRRSGDQDKD